MTIILYIFILYFSIFNTTGMSHLKITNCLYFFIYPCTGVQPDTISQALLWRFNVTDNNKTYFGLHRKY
jgi:hypothetical protein